MTLTILLLCLAPSIAIVGWVSYDIYRQIKDLS
jgi:hypothetical protein